MPWFPGKGLGHYIRDHGRFSQGHDFWANTALGILPLLYVTSKDDTLIPGKKCSLYLLQKHKM